jgi:pimeloyl-[acyl-carrier protein] methyl ester esterase
MRHRPVPLVLLPGLDGTDVFFRPLLRLLPASVQPIVVQFPADCDEYGPLLDIVLDATRDLDGYWVLGWSFSGPLALMLAEREPRKTQGVILCASFVRPPMPLLGWCRPLAIAEVIAIVRLVRRVPVFLAGGGADARRDKTETWARVRAGTLAARVRTILGVDVRDLLRRCGAPIVYLASSRDRIVPRRNIADVVQHAPATRVFTIDGPHLAVYTNPQAAADVITHLLSESAQV